MSLVDGLITGLNAIQPGLGLDQRSALEHDARELLEDNHALLSLQQGELVEDFALPNPLGETIRLSELLRRGPVVLTFYRGSWCNYCSRYLSDLESFLPHIRAAGAELVAISPQTIVSSAQTVDALALSYPVLSDFNHAVARRFGLVFTLPEAFRKAYQDLGIDLPRFNGTSTFELPIPATYVIDVDARIAYASVDPDYTRRPDPQTLLVHVEALRLPIEARPVVDG
ncbi:MAG: AhpC/TSA family protein [Rhodospirillales bacterium]|nr:AhpC/TSA family protein [Rhodospirillales bacterium]